MLLRILNPDQHLGPGLSQPWALGPAKTFRLTSLASGPSLYPTLGL